MSRLHCCPFCHEGQIKKCQCSLFALLIGLPNKAYKLDPQTAMQVTDLDHALLPAAW